MRFIRYGFMPNLLRYCGGDDKIPSTHCLPLDCDPWHYCAHSGVMTVVTNATECADGSTRRAARTDEYRNHSQ